MIDCVFVPANCTGELQPMDLSVNKSVKDFLKVQFQEWYAAEVLKITILLAQKSNL